MSLPSHNFETLLKVLYGVHICSKYGGAWEVCEASRIFYISTTTTTTTITLNIIKGSLTFATLR